VKTQKILAGREKGAKPGCGITRKGLGEDPDGYLYPCHRAVEMGHDFAIGSVFNGIDPVREVRIRKKVSVIPEKCRSCGIGCFPCPVVSYKTTGKLNSDPDDWYCEALKIRIKVVKELSKRRIVIKAVKPQKAF